MYVANVFGFNWIACMQPFYAFQSIQNLRLFVKKRAVFRPIFDDNSIRCRNFYNFVSVLC